MAQATAVKSLLSSSEVAAEVQRWPSNTAVVLARYVAETAQMRLDVVKVQRKQGCTVIYKAQVSPAHGEKHVSWGHFRSNKEIQEQGKKDRYARDAGRSSYTTAGRNPYRRFYKGFKEEADPFVFHDISWQGVQAVLGHQMRVHGATLGYIQVPKMDWETHQKTSGNLFKRTVTTTIQGYATPKTWIAFPYGMSDNPEAQTADICIVDLIDNEFSSENGMCPSVNLVLRSNVTVELWEGGNMPDVREKVFETSFSKSGFSVLGLGILLVIVSFGAAAMLNMAFAPAAGAPLGGTMAGSATSALANLIPTAAQAAAVTGGIYTLGAAIEGAGPMDMVEGTKGIPMIATWPTTGEGKPVEGMSEYQQAATEIMKAKQLAVPPDNDYALQGAQKLYSGDCRADQSAAECAAQGAGDNTGITPRWDRFQYLDQQPVYKRRMDECMKRYPKDIRAARKCAAPKETNTQLPFIPLYGQPQ